MRRKNIIKVMLTSGILVTMLVSGYIYMDYMNKEFLKTNPYKIEMVDATASANPPIYAPPSDLIKVNLANKTLSLYIEGNKIGEYPVGSGSLNTPTPTGEFSVQNLEVWPTWIDPDSKTTIPGGPGNPLGPRWIGVNGNVGIHGNNAAWSIGSYVSHGCIRMDNNNVLTVFDYAYIDMPVSIVYERVDVKREGQDVYLRIFPDGMGRQELSFEIVKDKLITYGISDFLDMDMINTAIANSSSEYILLGNIYDIYTNSGGIPEKMVQYKGKYYIPIEGLSKAMNVEPMYLYEKGIIRTEYGTAKIHVFGDTEYVEKDDVSVAFHTDVSFDGKILHLSPKKRKVKIYFKSIYDEGAPYYQLKQKIDSLFGFPFAEEILTKIYLVDIFSTRNFI